MRETKIGVGTILIRGETVLVGLRSDGTWGFPGGSIEFHENPYTAAVQEVLEETGIVIEETAIQCVEVTHSLTSELVHGFDLYFEGFAPEGQEAMLLEPHACQEWRWPTWNEFKNLNLMPPNHRLLARGYRPPMGRVV